MDSVRIMTLLIRLRIEVFSPYKACWKANTTPAEILRLEFRERER